MDNEGIFKERKSMNQVIENWNWRRLLRLILSIVIIVQGLISREWMFVILGGLFSALALFNKSMCGISPYCETSSTLKSSAKEDIHFDEVK